MVGSSATRHSQILGHEYPATFTVPTYLVRAASTLSYVGSVSRIPDLAVSLRLSPIAFSRFSRFLWGEYSSWQRETRKKKKTRTPNHADNEKRPHTRFVNNKHRNWTLWDLSRGLKSALSVTLVIISARQITRERFFARLFCSLDCLNRLSRVDKLYSGYIRRYCFFFKPKNCIHLFLSENNRVFFRKK